MSKGGQAADLAQHGPLLHIRYATVPSSHDLLGDAEVRSQQLQQHIKRSVLPLPSTARFISFAARHQHPRLRGDRCSRRQFVRLDRAAPLHALCSVAAWMQTPCSPHTQFVRVARQ